MLADVNVNINEHEVKKMVNEKIDDMVREYLIMIDVPTLAKKMSCSARFLEEELLHDPRIKALERKKIRKRLYFVDELLPVLKEVINERW